MQRTRRLQELGQSLWLDNITRDMLDDGTLQRYRDELSVTGLTSNPTIFEAAIGAGHAYDEQIRTLAPQGLKAEQLFSDLAMADVQRAADLFRPIFERTLGRDGWVSMEVSPLLINDPTATVLAAKEIHGAAARPNLFVKIPGSKEGVAAIEETLFAGIPVNVTLLFSTEQYLAVAEAYMRAMERRVAAGLKLDVTSVASLFVSRWDRAVATKIPVHLQNKLGVAVAHRTFRAYRELLASTRWQQLAAQGARPQRMLWASTGTKDPKSAPDMYVTALAIPDTINTIPEKTLLFFAAQGGTVVQPAEIDAEAALAEFRDAGIDLDAVAAQLQEEGGTSFTKSWQSLMQGIDAKTALVEH